MRVQLGRGSSGERGERRVRAWKVKVVGGGGSGRVMAVVRLICNGFRRVRDCRRQKESNSNSRLMITPNLTMNSTITQEANINITIWMIASDFKMNL